jgi:hypothetical protein
MPWIKNKNSAAFLLMLTMGDPFFDFFDEPKQLGLVNTLNT